MVRDEQVAVGCFLNEKHLLFISYQTKTSAYKPLSRELLDYVSEANVVAVSDSWVYKRVSLVGFSLSLSLFCLSLGRAPKDAPTEPHLGLSTAAHPFVSSVHRLILPTLPPQDY